MERISQHAAEGQKAMRDLYASMESNLALATHAEGWSWKDAAVSGVKNLESNRKGEK